MQVEPAEISDDDFLYSRILCGQAPTECQATVGHGEGNQREKAPVCWARISTRMEDRVSLPLHCAVTVAALISWARKSGTVWETIGRVFKVLTQRENLSLFSNNVVPLKQSRRLPSAVSRQAGSDKK